MFPYSTIIDILQYGFSAVFLLTGALFVFFSVRREGRRGFLRVVAVLGYILWLVALILLIFLGGADRDAIFLYIKAIATAFATIFGIYAALNDLSVMDPETGRRKVTMVGLVGIVFFAFNAVFSFGADSIRHIMLLESRIESDRQSREEFDRLSKNLGDVRSSLRGGAAEIVEQFRALSEDLLRQVKSAEEKLTAAENELARERGRIEALGNERDRLSASLAAAQKETGAAQEQQAAAEALKARAEDDATKRVAAAEKKLSEAQARVSALQGEKLMLEAEVIQTNADVAGLEKTAEDLKARLSSTETKLQNAVAARSAAEQQLAAANEKSRGLEQQLAAAKDTYLKRIADLEQGLQKQRTEFAAAIQRLETAAARSCTPPAANSTEPATNQS